MTPNNRVHATSIRFQSNVKKIYLKQFKIRFELVWSVLKTTSILFEFIASVYKIQLLDWKKGVPDRHPIYYRLYAQYRIPHFFSFYFKTCLLVNDFFFHFYLSH